MKKELILVFNFERSISIGCLSTGWSPLGSNFFHQQFIKLAKVVKIWSASSSFSAVSKISQRYAQKSCTKLKSSNWFFLVWKYREQLDQFEVRRHIRRLFWKLHRNPRIRDITRIWSRWACILQQFYKLIMHDHEMLPINSSISWSRIYQFIDLGSLTNGWCHCRIEPFPIWGPSTNVNIDVPLSASWSVAMKSGNPIASLRRGDFEESVLYPTDETIPCGRVYRSRVDKSCLFLYFNLCNAFTACPEKTDKLKND